MTWYACLRLLQQHPNMDFQGHPAYVLTQVCVATLSGVANYVVRLLATNSCLTEVVQQVKCTLEQDAFHTSVTH
jgi:hypothetical protein